MVSVTSCSIFIITCSPNRLAGVEPPPLVFHKAAAGAEQGEQFKGANQKGGLSLTCIYDPSFISLGYTNSDWRFYYLDFFSVFSKSPCSSFLFLFPRNVQPFVVHQTWCKREKIESEIGYGTVHLQECRSKKQNKTPQKSLQLTISYFNRFSWLGSMAYKRVSAERTHYPYGRLHFLHVQLLSCISIG